MTKPQKIWLSVFLAMFLIPELLWSPIGNFAYEWFQNTNSVVPLRNNFLMDLNNINWFSSVVFIQMAGLLLLVVYLLIINKNIKNKLALWSGIVLSFILLVAAFFTFGLSVSLRHIGF